MKRLDVQQKQTLSQIKLKIAADVHRQFMLPRCSWIVKVFTLDPEPVILDWSGTSHVAHGREAPLHAGNHAKATAGVECRKDADVIGETPMAYKSIAAVMEAQRDPVDVVQTLRQIVFVNG